MNLKSCERKEKNVAVLTIETETGEFTDAINEAYKKIRHKISVPGFRKGKAPRKIIEKMYGAAVFYDDALDVILPSVISCAIEKTDFKIVALPQVTDMDISEDNTNAVFTVAVSIYPEITVGQYKGLSAVKPNAEVPESAIESELTSVQKRNARIEAVDRPAQNGDTAIFDFEGFVDGENFEGGSSKNYELVLGSNNFIAGFEDQMLGMKIGEERDLNLVFPEQYAEHLAGKPVLFKVKLNELKQEILPEIDDEFAKDVSEFDTLEEYKADILAGLVKEYAGDANNAYENALMDLVIDTVEGEIPDAMVEEQVNNAVHNMTNQLTSYGMDPGMYFQMMNTTEEEFRENIRPNAERQVKLVLALEKIAELENIEITDEDVETEYKEAAERYGADLAEMKESVKYENVSRDLKMRRAAKMITENAIALPPEETETAEANAEDTKAEDTPEKPKKTTRKTTKKTESDGEKKPKKSAAGKFEDFEDTGEGAYKTE